MSSSSLDIENIPIAPAGSIGKQSDVINTKGINQTQSTPSPLTSSSGSNVASGVPTTTVYPRNLAQKQLRKFARSADKRQSVHMLGSIEHLQHHFVSTSLIFVSPLWMFTSIGY